MGMWQNHRARQAGKYQKVVAQQQAQLLGRQAATAQPAASHGAWRAGYDQGWSQGWEAGQRDLVDAIRTGRLSWEEVCRRIPG